MAFGVFMSTSEPRTRSGPLYLRLPSTEQSLQDSREQPLCLPEQLPVLGQVGHQDEDVSDGLLVADILGLLQSYVQHLVSLDEISLLSLVSIFTEQ